jgi:uncharacterized protein
MSAFDPLPRAARPFLGFVTLLRANGFVIAPEQTTSYLAAISLLGPRDPEDIRRAGLAMLAPPPERHGAYNALFRMHFLGEDTPAPGDAENDDDIMRVQEEQRADAELPLADESNQSGQAATGAEALVERRLAREAPARLPQRRSYRRMRGRRGQVDLRRTLRDAVRSDGEVLRLARLKRRQRPRKILLLIDVSGSMKTRTEENLRFAHALSLACPRIEVFTFGTRLTRVTRPLHLKQREQALAAAAALVSDWDGGTRIGDALQAFLAVPRFSGYARGAAVLIVSDGLERGDPRAMSDAVAKLSRRAWRLSWLTPLAVAKNFQPQTEALMAISRFVDDMVDGGSTSAIVQHVLRMARGKAA